MEANLLPLLFEARVMETGSLEKRDKGIKADGLNYWPALESKMRDL